MLVSLKGGELMKKTVSLLLTVMLCVLLIGCSNQNAAEGTPVQINYDAATVSYLGPEGTYVQ